MKRREIFHFVSQRLISLLSILHRGGCTVAGKLGCVVIKIRDAPLLMSDEIKILLECSDMASRALQCGICSAVGLSDNIANDTFAVEVAFTNPNITQFRNYSKQISCVSLYKTDIFKPTDCRNICRMVSKGIRVMRTEAWFLDGRFMLFGLSPRMKPIRLGEAISSTDETEIEWMADFCDQISSTKCLKNLFHQESGTLKADDDSYYYVAVIVGSAIIPRASHLTETIFRKLKIRFEREEEIFVSPDLSRLKKMDEELSISLFGLDGDDLNIDEKLWVDTCFSCEDEDILTQYLTNREKLLEANFLLLSSKSRPGDSHFGKFVCLTRVVMDISSLCVHDTPELAQEESFTIFPPVCYVGRVGVDF
jgi:hypothetical protein